MIQLSDFQNYHTDNLVFSKPEIGNIPGQKLSFKRIKISTKYEDGVVGDLIFSTPDKLHSFGLQESRDLSTNKLNGYVLPLCLWNRNGPTESEKKFTEIFNDISEYCKKYLIENKESIEKYDLDLSDLKKFNPLFWKLDKGKPVEGRGPMLYSKVLLNKKNNKINTIFVDEDTNKEIDPFSILNKPCNVTAAIKFESIFIGNKISLQVKLYEVVVKNIETGIRGLLRPNATKIDSMDGLVGKPVEVNVFSALSYDDESEEEEEEEDDDDGSIVLEEPVVSEIPVDVVQEIQQEAVIDKKLNKKPPAKPRGKKV
jgi:hypothetical protein